MSRWHTISAESERRQRRWRSRLTRYVQWDWLRWRGCTSCSVLCERVRPVEELAYCQPGIHIADRTHIWRSGPGCSPSSSLTTISKHAFQIKFHRSTALRCTGTAVLLLPSGIGSLLRSSRSMQYTRTWLKASRVSLMLVQRRKGRHTVFRRRWRLEWHMHVRWHVRH